MIRGLPVLAVARVRVLGADQKKKRILGTRLQKTRNSCFWIVIFVPQPENLILWKENLEKEIIRNSRFIQFSSTLIGFYVVALFVCEFTCKLSEDTASTLLKPLNVKICQSSVPPRAFATGCTLCSTVTRDPLVSSSSATECILPKSMSARPNVPDVSMNTWRLKTSGKEERNVIWNDTNREVKNKTWT